MTRLVETLAKRGCLTIDQTEQISTLALLLKKYNIGCLVVTSGTKDNPVGIVSERDLVKHFNEINNNEVSLIRDIMTTNLIYCDLNSSSKVLMQKMTRYKVRHLPIMRGKKLVGIVSIGDVVNRIIHNYEEEAKYMKEYIRG